ncbi:MAG: BamA/TamA family outer membrane protein [Magnetococcales bacterium]|nr:BamA/TamA family outer membrane protein [Magnetococcales bacterium]
MNALGGGEKRVSGRCCQAGALCLLLAGIFSASMAWAADEKVTYGVFFHGLDGHPELLTRLQSLSMALKRQDRPPDALSGLQARAREDAETFVQALKADGWFDARVDATITGEEAPRVVTFVVQSGVRYRYGRLVLKLPPTPTQFVPPSMDELGLHEDDFAQSAPVFAAGEKLLLLARQQGFPRARLLDHPLELDRQGHRLQVGFVLELGEFVRLGRVTFQGAEGIKPSFLEEHLSWRPGAVYHPKRFDGIYRSLMGTGLFSSVKVALGTPPGKGDLWPVTVRLIQRKHRSVALGGGFSTDKGLNLKGSWEHRNVLEVGQRFKIKTELGTEAQMVSLAHETPDFLVPEQKLTLSLQLDRSQASAFDSQSVQVGGTLLRPVWAPGGEAGLGVEWRIADVVDNSSALRSSFASTAIPMTLKLDRSDDLLDPGQGWRSHNEVKPVLALSKSGQSHVMVSNRGSLYHKLSQDPRVVVAFRGEADTVAGAGHDNLAADQRLYAGGSATLRGVGNQLAGQLDQANKPMGGRSLLALGSEVRWLVKEDWGLVAFLDGARSYRDSWPDLSEGMLFGAGVGGRYTTPFGPLRLDVGLPLHRRTGVDDPFQIYISIGQAF